MKGEANHENQKQQAKKLSKEFREEAIKLALDLSSLTQAAKDLEIPSSTLHGWIHQAKGCGFYPRVKE